MTEHRYKPLPQGYSTIRLLRLLPAVSKASPLQGELIEFTIQESQPYSHPYEALSYVWGDAADTKEIRIDGARLLITRELHTALSYLRERELPRILWVDAICINQRNETDSREKEQQIRIMPAIYAKAFRVDVWLGEASDESDLALEFIRAPNDVPVGPHYLQQCKQAITSLLERPWFSRIWILQEMAAARHIIVKCGFLEMDGHAFTSGLDLLKLDQSTCLVTWLMRAAGFRPRHVSRLDGRISLAICTLAELLDMHHSQKATWRHDKIYALLGMSTDDLNVTALEPDYTRSWSTLMRELVVFILGDKVQVHTWTDREVAVTRGKGQVLGGLSYADKPRRHGDGLNNDEETTSERLIFEDVRGLAWNVKHASPSPLLQAGDILCLMEGAPRPIVVRSCCDHFVIVAMAPIITAFHEYEDRSTQMRFLQPDQCSRDLVLSWDWESDFQSQRDSTVYNKLIEATFSDLAKPLDHADRLWNTALVLEEGGQSKLANGMFREAVTCYEQILRKRNESALEGLHGLTRLSWRAVAGRDCLEKLLLTQENIIDTLKDERHGQELLHWAVEGKHTALVKSLFQCDTLDVNQLDKMGRTALFLAARCRHDELVEMLLGNGGIKPNAIGDGNDTPFMISAASGHEAVARLLMKHKDVDVNALSRTNDTALLVATRRGFRGIIEALLQHKDIMVNKSDKNGTTPLHNAVRAGQLEILQLLLKCDGVNINAEDNRGRTPLSMAFQKNDEAIICLLAANKNVQVDAKISKGQTPLSIAAEKGYEDAVRVLLARSDVQADSKDGRGWTPLILAVYAGHEAVVRLLLARSDVWADWKDVLGRTPLIWAAWAGYEAIVRVLAARPDVDIEATDVEGRTPRWHAKKNRHMEIARFLEEVSLERQGKAQQNHRQTQILAQE